MKTFIISLLTLLYLGVNAQTNAGAALCVNPECPITFRATDTAKVAVRILTSDGYAKTVWSQPAGQNLVIKDTMIWVTNLMGYEGFSLIGQQPGNYTATATVTSSTGNVMSVPVTFTILAAIPACPAPRMIAMLQVNFFGTWIPVPVNSNTVKVVYSDGSTQ